MSTNQTASPKHKPGFRPGVCVKNGKLYAFSKERIVVVKGWPEMAAWTKTYRRPNWTRFRPAIDFHEGSIEAKRTRHQARPSQYCRHEVETSDPFDPLIPLAGRFLDYIYDKKDRESVRQNLPTEFRVLLAPVVAASLPPYDPLSAIPAPAPPEPETDNGCNADDREKLLVRHYFSTVPWEIRKPIAPFESRQWHLFVMAARCSGSLDLLKGNPALAYALASCWAFGPYESGQATRVMRRLIGLRRRKICAALGFEDSEWAVSIFAKIAPAACTVSWLLTIRDLLRDPEWRKTLQHLPTIDVAVMEFLCNRSLRRSATRPLLHELQTSVKTAI